MKNQIVLSHNSLTQFFYGHLSEVNKKAACPLPEEFIFYSSKVLDKYSLSTGFFENHDSGVCDKGLGYKFIEAKLKGKEERKSIYQEVGDLVLMNLGFFSKNMEKKKLNKRFYMDIAKTAYVNLENLDCSFYDIPNFYNLYATSFERMVALVEKMASSVQFENYDQYILQKEESGKLILSSGLHREVS